MSGTKAGGIKARNTNYLRHGDDFYKNIGKIGGASGNTGGFASDKVGQDGLTGLERARIAGAKGGAKSKRGPAKKNKKEYMETLTVQDAQRKYERAKEIYENGVLIGTII